MRANPTALTCMLSLVLAGLAGPASAQTGTINFWWDVCNDVATPANQNKTFTGPLVCSQVLSLSNAGDTAEGNDLAISIRSSSHALPDAWRFDAAGCNSSRAAATVAGVTKLCPPFLGTAALPVFQFSYDATTGTGLLQLGVAFDDFHPSPATTYTLWQISYDHAQSVAGPGTPLLTCGGAEGAICFTLVRAFILNGQNAEVPATVGHGFVTWNDPLATSGCPGSVAAGQVTWGAIKSQYR